MNPEHVVARRSSEPNHVSAAAAGQSGSGVMDSVDLEWTCQWGRATQGWLTQPIMYCFVWSG